MNERNLPLKQLTEQEMKTENSRCIGSEMRNRKRKINEGGRNVEKEEITRVKL